MICGKKKFLFFPPKLTNLLLLFLLIIGFENFILVKGKYFVEKSRLMEALIVIMLKVFFFNITFILLDISNPIRSSMKKPKKVIKN